MNFLIILIHVVDDADDIVSAIDSFDDIVSIIHSFFLFFFFH